MTRRTLFMLKILGTLWVGATACKARKERSTSSSTNAAPQTDQTKLSPGDADEALRVFREETEIEVEIKPAAERNEAFLTWIKALFDYRQQFKELNSSLKRQKFYGAPYSSLLGLRITFEQPEWGANLAEAPLLTGDFRIEVHINTSLATSPGQPLPTDTESSISFLKTSVTYMISEMQSAARIVGHHFATASSYSKVEFGIDSQIHLYEENFKNFYSSSNLPKIRQVLQSGMRVYSSASLSKLRKSYNFIRNDRDPSDDLKAAEQELLKTFRYCRVTCVRPDAPRTHYYVRACFDLEQGDGTIYLGKRRRPTTCGRLTVPDLELMFSGATICSPFEIAVESKIGDLSDCPSRQLLPGSVE